MTMMTMMIVFTKQQLLTNTHQAFYIEGLWAKLTHGALKLLFPVLGQICWIFHMWTSDKHSPEVCSSFAVKTDDYGYDFHFILKTKWKTADKTTRQHFLKEEKATCKKFGESGLRQQKAIQKVLWVKAMPRQKNFMYTSIL